MKSLFSNQAGSNTGLFNLSLRCSILLCAFLLVSNSDALGQFRTPASKTAYSINKTSNNVTVNHQDDDPIPNNDSTVGVQGGRYGLGLASSWPAYGISGTLQVSETLTAEAVLGFFGAVSNFGARGMYRFNRNVNYDIYGYAGIGIYRYRGFDDIFFDRRVSESVLGFGGGVGIESGLPKLFKDEEFPPIFVNAELGLALASFEYYGGFSSIFLGLGIHYRFGEK